MNPKLIYFMNKINQTHDISLDNSMSIFESSESLNNLINNNALENIDQNKNIKPFIAKKKKKNSCFGRTKKISHINSKFYFLNPHVFNMESQELKKELLSHKSTISAYLHYSFSQDNINHSLNINKIFQHEYFCKNFFTFRKDPKNIQSKHVYLILDGCYTKESNTQNSFTQRLFEENIHFSLMEFVWQDFLKNKSYIVTPKMNTNFQTLAKCKKHYSNCLGNFN